jgi:hypothetical protein
MSYILNMLIYVDMIFLDNLLQYLLFIAVIDLSRSCDSIATLIRNALVVIMIYSWIKIKLKELIFPTGGECGGQRGTADDAIRRRRRWAGGDDGWRAVGECEVVALPKCKVVVVSKCDGRKETALFPNPAYIRRLTDEYMWVIPVSPVPPIFIGLAT